MMLCAAQALRVQHIHRAAWCSLLLVTRLQAMSLGGQQLVRDVKADSLVIGERQQLSTLGSRPPCCERKCGGCAPCTAIQVRTATDGFRPQCSNYEPIGWKCKCGTAVFDP